MNEDNQSIFQRAISGVKQFTRPQTGTLATSGRQVIQNIARTPLTPVQKRTAEAIMSVLQPAADYSRHQVFGQISQGVQDIGRAVSGARSGGVSGGDATIAAVLGSARAASGVWGAVPIGAAENIFTGMVAGGVQNLR